MPELPNNLQELKEVMEKTISLLSEPETGFMTWHGFLADNVRKIHELTSKMVKKGGK